MSWPHLGSRRVAVGLGPSRLSPEDAGDAPLDDGEVVCGDLALGADLVAGSFGHPRGAPALHSCDVQFW